MVMVTMMQLVMEKKRFFAPCFFVKKIVFFKIFYVY